MAHTLWDGGHDHEKWVTMSDDLDDELDGLLRGRATPAESAALLAVIARLRELAISEPVPPMGDALLAQVQAAARARRGASRALALAVGAGAVVLLGLLGVGAAQNRLPSGLQDVMSSTADLVGLHVPESAERQHGAGDDGGPEREADGSDPVGGAGADRGKDAPGYGGTTPGGATPADPGTPGDREPATPAVPPSVSARPEPGDVGDREQGSGRSDAGPDAGRRGKP